jgi:hypothetical protein
MPISVMLVNIWLVNNFLCFDPVVPAASWLSFMHLLPAAEDSVAVFVFAISKIVRDSLG